MLVQTLYLLYIVDSVVTYNILNELIINFDQTPSKYFPTATDATAEKNSNHTARKEANDKGRITATLAESMTGEVLPLQLI